MSLPKIIEIVPLTKPAEAKVAVPGSKSITNRALVLAALAEAPTTLRSALWSEDTQVMVECLRKLGFEVGVSSDPEEACNRTITVRGWGGEIPGGGTEGDPLELFVGNAGTAARFLSALLCLGEGVYLLQGVPRMHERPQAALFEALRQLGYRIDSPTNKLPAVIHGAGPSGKSCRVSIEESSQFASALLLCAKAGGWKIEVEGENAEESPYVSMTSKLIETFPWKGGSLSIEPDASSGSYFWAADFLLRERAAGQFSETGRAARIAVVNWPNSGWQVDQDFKDYCLRSRLPETISREGQLGDSILTAMILAPFQQSATRFADLNRLRLQECDRIMAMRKGLTQCGAKVIEEGDWLEIFPAKLKTLSGAQIETYNDHRIAMCFATLGLKVPNLRIKGPGCVKKTFPNFFQKFAAPPPAGLGAGIRDVASGRLLHPDELFAD
jgi:3-phosphoshikimate 1-carboxyvinyltransferase